MPIIPKINLEYSYLKLPVIFHHLETPESLNNPEVILLNHSLLDEFGLPLKNNLDYISFISNKNISSFSQAYAGHQFGHFTKLGDGRAIILGEFETPFYKKIDIQQKGCGRTFYSRGGDGKATLKAMLREFLISEAMYYLKIPSSRSLAVVKTGNWVYRETKQEGAVLTRLMKSHIRVGTFEYARHFGTKENQQELASYTINRLFPEIKHNENSVLDFLKKVINLQIELVINWMRVGFIHGVMNTDNVSISGETFDYGPCAFMNTYNPNTVFSSIDSNARYAFGNQPRIIKWNLTRFAESLLPILHDNPDKSLYLAQNAIDEFDNIWKNKYYQMMLHKIGLENNNPSHYFLVDELLDIMFKNQLDYTNTFWELSNDTISNKNLELKFWREKWYKIIKNSSKKAKELMKMNNPVIIPRNHLVEQALDEATKGSMNLFNELHKALINSYNYENNLSKFMNPPNEDFEKSYYTFCGT